MEDFIITYDYSEQKKHFVLLYITKRMNGWNKELQKK